MSLKRPNSVLIKARNPPSTPIDLMEELERERVSDHVRCVQQGKKFEWVVSFSDSAFVEKVELTLAEDQHRDFIAVRLRVNEKSKCTLEGVPFEFSNANIGAQLSQYFEEMTIEMETYRNIPEVFNGNRIIKYKGIKKPPPNKISLGRGISGWINNVESRNLADYHIKCRRCGDTGHLAEGCTAEARCIKCSTLGHETRDCEEENCKNCYSKFHTTWLCPKEGSARSRGGKWSDRLRDSGEPEENYEENTAQVKPSEAGITEEKEPSFIEVDVSPAPAPVQEDERDIHPSTSEKEESKKKGKEDDRERKEEEETKEHAEDEENGKMRDGVGQEKEKGKDEKKGETEAKEENRTRGDDKLTEAVAEIEASQTKRLKDQLSKRMKEVESGGLKMVLERQEEGDSWSIGQGSTAWSETTETPEAGANERRSSLRGKQGKKGAEVKKKSPIQKLGEKIRGKIGGDKTPSQRRRNRSDDQEAGKEEKKMRK